MGEVGVLVMAVSGQILGRSQVLERRKEAKLDTSFSRMKKRIGGNKPQRAEARLLII